MTNIKILIVLDIQKYDDTNLTSHLNKIIDENNLIILTQNRVPLLKTSHIKHLTKAITGMFSKISTKVDKTKNVDIDKDVDTDTDKDIDKTKTVNTDKDVDTDTDKDVDTDTDKDVDKTKTVNTDKDVDTDTDKDVDKTKTVNTDKDVDTDTDKDVDTDKSSQKYKNTIDILNNDMDQIYTIGIEKSKYNTRNLAYDFNNITKATYYKDNDNNKDFIKLNTCEISNMVCTAFNYYNNVRTDEQWKNNYSTGLWEFLITYIKTKYPKDYSISFFNLDITVSDSYGDIDAIDTILEGIHSWKFYKNDNDNKNIKVNFIFDLRGILNEVRTKDTIKDLCHRKIMSKYIDGPIIKGENLKKSPNIGIGFCIKYNDGSTEKFTFAAHDGIFRIDNTYFNKYIKYKQKYLNITNNSSKIYIKS